jgi:hypothetical protein
MRLVLYQLYAVCLNKLSGVFYFVTNVCICLSETIYKCIIYYTFLVLSVSKPNLIGTYEHIAQTRFFQKFTSSLLHR